MIDGAQNDDDGIHRFKLADWLTSLPVNWWLMNCGRCRNYCIFRLFLCTFWFGNGRCTALYGYMRTHGTRTPQCVECIDAGKWGRRRKWWFQFFFSDLSANRKMSLWTWTKRRTTHLFDDLLYRQFVLCVELLSSNEFFSFTENQKKRTEENGLIRFKDLN